MSTIDKALDVLFLLGNQSGALRLTDVASALAMPRSSTHRVLAPLLRRGLVEQDVRGHYQVGFGLVALGLGAAAREPLALAARPLLEAAADELGETFFLVVARAGRLRVLEKAEGNGFLRAAPQLGANVPVHATAVGKLFLAHAPEAVEAGEMTPFTEATRHTPDRLAADVARARADGYALNDEEWQAGLSVVAAPVFVRAALVGAVALAMVAPRLHELGTPAAARRVIHVAEGVALRMEGSAP